jgi:hypothetical protein
MIALGCVVLLVFPLIGVLLGAWLGGNEAMLIGGVAGLILAIAACAVPVFALLRAGRRR